MFLAGWFGGGGKENGERRVLIGKNVCLFIYLSFDIKGNTKVFLVISKTGFFWGTVWKGVLNVEGCLLQILGPLHLKIKQRERKG